jgi:hypothetical protein
MWIARLYLWRWLPGGKRARFYSINAMRLQHPAWFREDLERLFALLAGGAIHPRLASVVNAFVSKVLPVVSTCSSRPARRPLWVFSTEAAGPAHGAPLPREPRRRARDERKRTRDTGKPTDRRGSDAIGGLEIEGRTRIVLAA